MGLFRTIALLAGGAVAGYVASQSQNARKNSSTDLLKREDSTREIVSAMEGNMAKFFDSAVGKKLQPFALRTVEFAANVKRGMDERETELKQRFESQKQDLRPGSLDTWDRPVENDTNQPITPFSQISHAPMADSDVIEPDEISGTQTRIKRDAKLGDSFFE